MSASILLGTRFRDRGVMRRWMIALTGGCMLLGIACNASPPTQIADGFPQDVGPPFGLDALRGGMSRKEMSSTLAKDGSNTQRLNDALRADHRGIASVLT